MLNALTIKARLLILGAVAIIGVVTAGGFGMNRLAALDAEMEESLHAVSDGMKTMLHVSAANIEFKTQVQEWKNILIRGNDPETFDRYRKTFETSAKGVQEKLSAALAEMKKEKHPLVPKAEDALKLHADLNKLYAGQIEKWDPRDPGNTQKGDKALSGKDRPMTEAMTKLVEEYEKDELLQLEKQITNSQANYISSRNTLMVLVGGVLAIVFLLVTVTVSAINRQISTLQETLTRIRSSLDLSVRLPAEGSDEISTASRAVNELLQEFHGVVSRMKNSAGQVSGASEGLASSVSQLSDSVGQQNEATAAMAASVEELAVSVTHIADSSSAAQTISNDSAKHAQEGGKVIEKTVNSMVGMTDSLTTTAATVAELGKRSQEIGSIAGVIKEIADQTNLLALNAAIEAARAGETGRGFAVVADEVRKLAERTTKATAEIEAVIGAIQGDTQRAVTDMHNVVTLANDNAGIARLAGDAIISIRNGSSEVVNVTTDISTALKEQTAASDLIAQQVELIATMSDENTSALASVRNASEEMKTLSEEMHVTVDRFKV